MVCSHCLQDGHTKASQSCPLKGKDPAPRPDINQSVIRWTPEMEQQLRNRVDIGPLETNWEEIATIFDKPVTACKTRYNEIVSCEEDISSRLSRMTMNDIQALVNDSSKRCENCSCRVYGIIKQWKGKNICGTCHTAHKIDIEQLWEHINDHLDNINMNNCAICSHIRIKGEDPFQFDHLSMFNKKDSICSMVYRGDDLDIIKEEIAICQLLCRSCHYLVTKVEQTLGFTKIKQVMTRLKNSETLTTEQLTEEERMKDILYREKMGEIYNKLREFIISSSVQEHPAASVVPDAHAAPVAQPVVVVGKKVIVKKRKE